MFTWLISVKAKSPVAESTQEAVWFVWQGWKLDRHLAWTLAQQQAQSTPVWLKIRDLVKLLRQVHQGLLMTLRVSSGILAAVVGLRVVGTLAAVRVAAQKVESHPAFGACL
jgi:hypothetical protein